MKNAVDVITITVLFCLCQPGRAYANPRPEMRIGPRGQFHKVHSKGTTVTVCWRAQMAHAAQILEVMQIRTRGVCASSLEAS